MFLYVLVDRNITTARYEAELSEMEASTRDALDVRTRHLLRISSVLLGNSARDAILGDDLHKLRERVLAITHELGIVSIIVCDPHGLVLAASDTRLVDAPLERTFATIISTVNEESTERMDDSSYRTIVPLKAGPDRIGTLIVEFKDSE